VPGVVLNQLATQRGFELAVVQDYQVGAEGSASARRCVLYVRR
jgi:hypothetical protein